VSTSNPVQKIKKLNAEVYVTLGKLSYRGALKIKIIPTKSEINLIY
jgi:hypothetical protein